VAGSISHLIFSSAQRTPGRVLAVHAGSRSLRLLVAESRSGTRLRILHQHLIDLHQEGLVSAEETRTHLAEELADWGHPPVAVVLPQHLSISQMIDVTAGSGHEVEKLIQNESVKLSGVSNSQIVYDFVRTGATANDRQQFWVTLAREADIREHLLKLGLENEDLCHLSTTANSLIAAYKTIRPESARAVLLFSGAETTILAVVSAGAPAFAANFQMGEDFFTRSLARILNCSEDKAAELRLSTNYFSGPDADPKFITVVDGWADELKRQLEEFRLAHGEARLGADPFEFVATGTLFDQPGLLGYLQKKGFKLQSWPAPGGPDDPQLPKKGFEVAFGAAAQGLSNEEQSGSLLPQDFRLRWRERLTREKIEAASILLLVIAAVLLAAATWRQFNLVNHKQSLLAKVQAGQTAADENEQLSSAMITDYETLRPLFSRQQNTIDVLQTLTLLEQVRSNRSFWFVLAADQQSYFTAAVNPGSTNKPARTNAPVASLPLLPNVPRPAFTNVSAAKPGMIAELCIPEDPEAGRVLLSQIVKDLKQQPIFSKVDLLADDLRRNIADPKVTLADKDYVLSLDFTQTDFLAPGPRKAPPPRPAPRRPPHQGTTAAESEPLGQTGP
jgi:hypothetical protein